LGEWDYRIKAKEDVLEGKRETLGEEEHAQKRSVSRAEGRAFNGGEVEPVVKTRERSKRKCGVQGEKKL